MAVVYSRTCSICGTKTLKRDSFVVGPASLKTPYVVCEKCGKPIAQFLSKKKFYKRIHPKVSGRERERKLKTRRTF